MGKRSAVVLKTAALFILTMGTFSYQEGANPPIDWPRGLTGDTVELNPNGTRAYIYSDQEINMFTAIQANTTQSSQFYSPPVANTLPMTPVSYMRVAALMLDGIASDKARLSSVQQLLDVKLSPKEAAIQLRAQAAEYRSIDDNSGAFFIIEQCNTTWAFRDRFWSQVQRQQAGVLV